MVGISLLTLVPGIFGGSATYVDGLLRALARSGELEYRVFVPTIAEDAGDGLPTTVVSAYRASGTVPGRLAAMSRATLAPGSIRRQLRPGELDTIHYPLTVMVPLVDRPTVATAHDVLHAVYPRFFNRTELVYRRFVYRRLARANRVIAPSEHAKELLVERAAVAEDRIRIVPHGLDHERFSPGDAKREPFLLYPADDYPHKNHERLLAAFGEVCRERPELRLVLPGVDPKRRLPPRVEARGRVSVTELVELYRSASAVVFPSLHETFGFPPLEAMACGCPVASSNAGSLPEVCGDAARYFDPTSVDEIAAAVLDVLARADEFRDRGLRRSALFTWEESARAHEAVYRELASTNRRDP